MPPPTAPPITTPRWTVPTLSVLLGRTMDATLSSVAVEEVTGDSFMSVENNELGMPIEGDGMGVAVVRCTMVILLGMGVFLSEDTIEMLMG